jgi:tetratricopeptide (TPR) repeat protein
MLALQERIENLRSLDIPSMELVDAINALALELQEIDRQQCLALCQEAISISLLLKYEEGEAQAHNRLGWLRMQEGQLDIAMRHAMRAASLAELANNQRLQCGALYVSASVHQRVGNMSFALRDWFKLLHTAYKSSDLGYEADAYSQLGILYREEKDYQEAIDCYKQALKRYVALGDAREMHVLNNLANACACMADGAQALVYARLALDKCPSDWPAIRANFIDTLGRACLANDSPRLALAQFESGIKLYQMARVTGQVNADSVIAMLYQGASLALRKLGQFHQAAHKLDLALTEAERASDHPLQVEIHTDLASLMSLLGAKEMAQHHQARASALGHRLEHEQTVLRERVMDVFRAERNALPLAIGLAA